jgi:ABC-type bacteriocin/lantibiotic exporter with double-glycine peptidase domain
MIARLEITRVVIAHRPALVERADLVFALEQGRMVEVSRKPRTVANSPVASPSPSRT